MNINFEEDIVPENVVISLVHLEECCRVVSQNMHTLFVGLACNMHN